ncbi:hypothetical protein JRQ81_018062 [Phrynocephalus forsythii]|uniref:Integrase n=1 Tax=Phrynocephalus forsythii TaxID=171643 RepID=A0A9Q0XTH0_9SAUR|nr:hypothetical protein JRQ81_018062 [Phrynocephalus forsythii]
MVMVSEWLNEYLLVQHITPHASTGWSPAELLLGRHLRCPLDQLHLDSAVPDPPGSADVPRTFVPGNWVFARNYAGESAWVPTVVVALEDSCLGCRHINQLSCQAGDLETANDPRTVSVPEPTEAEHPLRDSGPQQPTPWAAVMPRKIDPDGVPPTPLIGFPGRPVAATSSMAVEPGRESSDCSETQSAPNSNEDPGGQATPDTGPRWLDWVQRRASLFERLCAVPLVMFLAAAHYNDLVIRQG